MTNIFSFKQQNSDFLYRLKHNTFVLEKHQLFYMDTPKTAGTSIKTLMASLSDKNYSLPDSSDTEETVKEMFIHDRQQNPVPNILSFSEEKQEEILFSEKWTKICVVRNPFTRIFSAWFSKILLRQPGYTEHLQGYNLRNKYENLNQVIEDFENFISYIDTHESQKFSNPHWEKQSTLLFDHQITWSRILKYENINLEINDLLAHLNINNLTLDHLNTSGYRPNMESLSNETIKTIQKLYKSDFELYNYPLSPHKTEDDTDEKSVILYINAVISRNDRCQDLMIEIRKTKEQKEKEQKESEFKISLLEEEIKNKDHEVSKLNSIIERILEELNRIKNSRGWRTILLLRKLRSYKEDKTQQQEL